MLYAIYTTQAMTDGDGIAREAGELLSLVEPQFLPTHLPEGVSAAAMPEGLSDINATWDPATCTLVSS